MHCHVGLFFNALVLGQTAEQLPPRDWWRRGSLLAALPALTPPRYEYHLFRILFSKQDLSKHCIGLVEAVLEMYGSAMRAWHPKPPQAFQVLCNCSLRDDITMIQTSRFAASPR